MTRRVINGLGVVAVLSAALVSPPAQVSHAGKSPYEPSISEGEALLCVVAELLKALGSGSDPCPGEYESADTNGDGINDSCAPPCYFTNSCFPEDNPCMAM